MDLKRAYDTLVELAKQKNLPVETVIREIEDAIKEAYEKSLANNNYIALEEWRRIPCVGELPTAVEMLAYLAEIAIPQTTNRESKANGKSKVVNNKLKS